VGVIRLTIAYDGTPFAGWAAQPGLRTVQGEIAAALERIAGERVALTVAGRTDAGVHAWGQVASFRLDGEAPDNLGHRLNALLPPAIAVVEAVPAPDGFDARGDAHSRTYCYWVLASAVRDPFLEGRALWWPSRVERVALERCAAALIGSHDFTAFTPTQTEHVRFERDVIHAEWRAHVLTPPFTGELLEFWIEADAFMRHMVRILVGTMLEVAGGRRNHADFESLLRGAPRERAGETAPAHGLYLAAVRYPGDDS
jgi:tRNA pseudouridine38-40 synthase